MFAQAKLNLTFLPDLQKFRKRWFSPYSRVDVPQLPVHYRAHAQHMHSWFELSDAHKTP